MNVKKLYPQGYCKGVYNAIKITLETKKLYPDEKIYILGLVIHNKLIKEKLQKLGIISLYSKDKTKIELLENINEGIIILTAHGTEQEVIKEINNKNLKYIDTTCNYVNSTYEIIKKELKNNLEVIYIGIHNHPEACATISINKNKIHLIENINDVTNLHINDDSPLITNQTTLSRYELEELYQEIIKYYPNARISNEQCSATRLRQGAIIDIKEDYDLIFIVGDTLSNNSKQLYNLAKKKSKAYLIESIEDINISWLKDINNIAITSGASTPSSIVKQIYDWLLKFDYNDPSTHIKPTINFDTLLDEFK